MGGERQTRARRRRWADVVILFAGVYALFYAVWAPPGLGPAEAAADAPRHGLWWWAHATGGALALAGLFVAQKSVVSGRVMTGVGALALLAGLMAFARIDWLAIRALVLPAVAILAATPFMGPMPSPEEEGKVRRGLGEDRDATGRPGDPARHG